MKGDGNGIGTLIEKLFFFCIPTSKGRTRWLCKHHKFAEIGENLFWQPRKLPADPELIKLGNNVNISSDVRFINHDIVSMMLNKKYTNYSFKEYVNCIEIGDNVMIGSGVTILPNVKIGNNVVIGAGAIVTNDVRDDVIVAGIPAREIGKFDDLVEKRRCITTTKDMDISEVWKEFNNQRKNIEK